jgi:surfeit locus 1 family protein
MRFSRDAVLTWLGAVVAVTATVRLGMWQLDRAAQKSAWVHDQAQRAQLPALTQADLARTPDLAMAQWFRPQLTLFLDNQPLDGRAGFVAVTPLLIAPGDAVLVQRGWAPRDPADRTRVSTPPFAPGVVSVAARVAPLPSRRFELGGADDGPIRQNLDAAELARQWGIELRPLSLLELRPTSPDDGWIRKWPAPAQDIGKHHGYAFQWFALAALIAGLTIWYRIVRPRP